MYHHFPSKIDLAAKGMQRNSLELEQAMDAHLAGAESRSRGVVNYLVKAGKA
jgi:hypothetical protein